MRGCAPYSFIISDWVPVERIGVKETIPFGEYMIVHIFLKVNPPVVNIQYKI